MHVFTDGFFCLFLFCFCSFDLFLGFLAGGEGGWLRFSDSQGHSLLIGPIRFAAATKHTSKTICGYLFGATPLAESARLKLKLRDLLEVTLIEVARSFFEHAYLVEIFFPIFV
jgi:hypothetical protein